MNGDQPFEVMPSSRKLWTRMDLAGNPVGQLMSRKFYLIVFTDATNTQEYSYMPELKEYRIREDGKTFWGKFFPCLNHGTSCQELK